MPIREYLPDQAVFEPNAIKAMSDALDQACKALHINGHIPDRETVAMRIIDLARSGVIDSKALANRVVAESKAMQSI